jgi:membrane-associated protease RseP (regulator of RpoE activity)
MAYYKEKINSVGVLLAGIFPIGAFVDQEDSTFEKLDDKKALAVLSAGPASNLFLVIVAWVLLNLFVFSVLPFSSQIQSEYGKAYSGVRVVSVSDTVSYCGLTVDSPAKGKLFSGDIVKSVNGTDINGISVLNYAFLDANGEMLFTVSRLNTDTNTFSDINVPLTPYKFEDLGIKRVGVEFGAISTGYEPRGEIVALQFVLSNISMILLLLFVISFAAGSFNYLPSDPFDGGKMAKIILEPYFGFMKFKSKKETRKFIGRLFIWLVLLAFLLNIIPYITLIF